MQTKEFSTIFGNDFRRLLAKRGVSDEKKLQLICSLIHDISCDGEISTEIAEIEMICSYEGKVEIFEYTPEHISPKQQAIIASAKGLLVYFSTHDNVNLAVINGMMQPIYELSDEDADIIFCVKTDASLNSSEIRATLLAGGVTLPLLEA